jgi:hypothetical protein
VFISTLFCEEWEVSFCLGVSLKISTEARHGDWWL